MSRTGPDTSRPVKSAERALEVLEILGAERGQLTVPELHHRTAYPRSSLHQLLHTMAAKGWVELSADGTVVGVGARALLVGTAYLDGDQALQHATGTLERLVKRMDCTVHYARRDNASVLYLATRESANRIEARHSPPRVGRELPVSTTALGKALLAELTDAEVATVVPDPLPVLTDHTVDNLPALLDELEQARSKGYALEREQSLPGTFCIAVAIGNRVPASDAISCSVPISRYNPDTLAHLATALREEVGILTERLKRDGIR